MTYDIATVIGGLFVAWALGISVGHVVAWTRGIRDAL